METFLTEMNEEIEMAAKPAKKSAVKATKIAKKPAAKKAGKKASAAPKSAAKTAKEEKKGRIPSGSKVEPAPLAAGSADESEEESDDFEAEGASRGGAGASAGLNSAAAAAVEVSSNTMKNFRHHPDMENFYRFIYDNDLRFEALTIIDQILAEKRAQKLLKATKSKAH